MWNILIFVEISLTQLKNLLFTKCLGFLPSNNLLSEHRNDQNSMAVSFIVGVLDSANAYQKDNNRMCAIYTYKFIKVEIS